MTRAETTKFLGQLLVSTRIGGAGSHWASEVSIDLWTSKAERVEYIQCCPANQYSVCVPDFRSGKFANYMREKHPDSSIYYGVMVPIPFWGEAAEEFKDPTPLSEDRNWKLEIVLPCRQGIRIKSMTELLFCMLRSGH